MKPRAGILAVLVLMTLPAAAGAASLSERAVALLERAVEEAVTEAIVPGAEGRARETTGREIRPRSRARWKPVVPMVLRTIAMLDGQRALALYGRLGSAEAFRDSLDAGMLAMGEVLQGPDRKALFNWFDGLASERRKNIAAMLPVRDPREAQRVLSKVADPVTVYLAGAIFAHKLWARGQTGLDELMRAEPPSLPEGAKQAYLVDVARLLRDQVAGRLDDARRRLASMGKKGQRLAVVGAMTVGTGAGGSASAADAFSTAMADVLGLEGVQRFEFGSYLCRGRLASPTVIAMLQSAWDPGHLANEVCWTGAFYLMRSLARDGDPQALDIGRALARAILDFKNAPERYHSLGATLSVMALRHPTEARKLADGIRTLEWRVHALRGIYRKWAERAPQVALAAIAGKEKWSDAMPRVALDLRLEAAVGSARRNPALALKTIQGLPADPERFEEGICLIAPALALKNQSQALGLLAPADRPMRAQAALAICRIVLDIEGKQFPDHRPFYPDQVAPVDTWPGPRLSRPLRFGSYKAPTR